VKDFIPFNSKIPDKLRFVQETQKYRFTKKLSLEAEAQSMTEKGDVFSPTTNPTTSNTNKSIVSQDEGAGGFSQLGKPGYVTDMSTKKYHGDLRATYGKVLDQQLDARKNRPMVT